MKFTKEKRTRFLAQAGIIAAVYALLTVVLGPLSFGPLQIRVAESLCILPYFTPAAIPGLFLGCILSNLFSPYGIPDIILGSLGTLLGALGTYAIAKKIKGKEKHKRALMLLLSIPVIVANAILVSLAILLDSGLPIAVWPQAALGVAVNELLSCTFLSLPLIDIFRKNEDMFTL